jgi:hypothetical protein
LGQSNKNPRYGLELDHKDNPSNKRDNLSNKEDDLKEKPRHKAFGTEYHLIVEYTPTASKLRMVDPEMEFKKPGQ